MTTYPLLRAFAVVALALALSTCSPPNRDIVVVARDGRLLIDFPFSFWRLVGLQDRDYCISRVELFDRQQFWWVLNMISDRRGCEHVTMPIAIGMPLNGFVASGRPILSPGRMYGIAIEGIGDARVSFVISRAGAVRNIPADEGQVARPLRIEQSRAF